MIENVSLPPEVEAALDQRSKMQMIGNLDQYSALQAADALRDAARNPSGGAAAGVGIGMGAAISQRAMGAPASATASGSEPPPIPHSDWYYAVSGERRGPISMPALEQLVTTGTVGAATLVWRSGMKDWAAAATVDELKAPLGSKPGSAGS